MADFPDCFIQYICGSQYVRKMYMQVENAIESAVLHKFISQTPEVSMTQNVIKNMV